MKTGDKVQILGVLNGAGKPQRCTLTAWHPNPYVKKYGTEGEWDYTADDGRQGSATVVDIFPWGE